MPSKKSTRARRDQQGVSKNLMLRGSEDLVSSAEEECGSDRGVFSMRFVVKACQGFNLHFLAKSAPRLRMF